MKKGDRVRIMRDTFLHKGVFVIKNSPAEILNENDGVYTILFRDKEGLEHIIEGFNPEELQEFS